MSAAFISVLKNPGAIPFTWTLCAAKLHGERAREHPHRALAHRVRDDVGSPDVGGERADVDDLAAAPRLHRRDERPGHEERPVEIRRHQRAPFGRREFLERLPLIHRRIVDEDVDRAERALDLRDALGDRGGIGDVERRRAGVEPVGWQATPMQRTACRGCGRSARRARRRSRDRAAMAKPSPDPPPVTSARVPWRSNEGDVAGTAAYPSPRTSCMSKRPARPCARCAATKCAARSAPVAKFCREAALCESSTRSPAPAKITVCSPTTSPPRSAREADGAALALADRAFARIDGVLRQRNSGAAGRRFAEAERGARRRVDLVPVMHLDDFDVVAGAEPARRVFDERQQNVDADAHVRREDDRNALRASPRARPSARPRVRSCRRRRRSDGARTRRGARAFLRGA